MMLKYFYDLLRNYLKQNARSQVKVQKSKLLIYDEYLKKYVSVDELLVPSHSNAHGGHTLSWKKSRELFLFDLLLKKFVNPKLDLLCPIGVNSSHFSNIWNFGINHSNLHTSVTNYPWKSGHHSKTNYGLTKHAKIDVHKETDLNELTDVSNIGWAGQVLKKPNSNPRPEHSTKLPDNQIHKKKRRDEKERNKVKNIKGENEDNMTDVLISKAQPDHGYSKVLSGTEKTKSTHLKKTQDNLFKKLYSCVTSHDKSEVNKKVAVKVVKSEEERKNMNFKKVYDSTKELEAFINKGLKTKLDLSKGSQINKKSENRIIEDIKTTCFKLTNLISNGTSNGSDKMENISGRLGMFPSLENLKMVKSTGNIYEKYAYCKDTINNYLKTNAPQSKNNKNEMQTKTDNSKQFSLLGNENPGREEEECIQDEKLFDNEANLNICIGNMKNSIEVLTKVLNQENKETYLNNLNKDDMINSIKINDSIDVIKSSIEDIETGIIKSESMKKSNRIHSKLSHEQHISNSTEINLSLAKIKSSIEDLDSIFTKKVDKQKKNQLPSEMLHKAGNEIEEQTYHKNKVAYLRKSNQECESKHVISPTNDLSKISSLDNIRDTNINKKCSGNSFPSTAGKKSQIQMEMIFSNLKNYSRDKNKDKNSKPTEVTTSHQKIFSDDLMKTATSKGKACTNNDQQLKDDSRNNIELKSKEIAHKKSENIESINKTQEKNVFKNKTTMLPEQKLCEKNELKDILKNDSQMKNIDITSRPTEVTYSHQNIFSDNLMKTNISKGKVYTNNEQQLKDFYKNNIELQSTETANKKSENIESINETQEKYILENQNSILPTQKLSQQNKSKDNNTCNLKKINISNDQKLSESDESGNNINSTSKNMNSSQTQLTYQKDKLDQRHPTDVKDMSKLEDASITSKNHFCRIDYNFIFPPKKTIHNDSESHVKSGFIPVNNHAGNKLNDTMFIDPPNMQEKTSKKDIEVLKGSKTENQIDSLIKNSFIKCEATGEKLKHHPPENLIRQNNVKNYKTESNNKDGHIDPNHTEILHKAFASGRSYDEINFEYDLSKFNIKRYKGFKIRKSDPEPRIRTKVSPLRKKIENKAGELQRNTTGRGNFTNKNYLKIGSAVMSDKEFGLLNKKNNTIGKEVSVNEDTLKFKTSQNLSLSSRKDSQDKEESSIKNKRSITSNKIRKQQIMIKNICHKTKRGNKKVIKFQQYIPKSKKGKTLKEENKIKRNTLNSDEKANISFSGNEVDLQLKLEKENVAKSCSKSHSYQFRSQQSFKQPVRSKSAPTFRNTNLNSSKHKFYKLHLNGSAGINNDTKSSSEKLLSKHKTRLRKILRKSNILSSNENKTRQLMLVKSSMSSPDISTKMKIDQRSIYSDLKNNNVPETQYFNVNKNLKPSLLSISVNNNREFPYNITEKMISNYNKRNLLSISNPSFNERSTNPAAGNKDKISVQKMLSLHSNVKIGNKSLNGTFGQENQLKGRKSSEKFSSSDLQLISCNKLPQRIIRTRSNPVNSQKIMGKETKIKDIHAIKQTEIKNGEVSKISSNRLNSKIKDKYNQMCEIEHNKNKFKDFPVLNNSKSVTVQKSISNAFEKKTVLGTKTPFNEKYANNNLGENVEKRKQNIQIKSENQSFDGIKFLDEYYIKYNKTNNNKHPENKRAEQTDNLKRILKEDKMLIEKEKCKTITPLKNKSTLTSVQIISENPSQSRSINKQIQLETKITSKIKQNLFKEHLPRNNKSVSARIIKCNLQNNLNENSLRHSKTQVNGEEGKPNIVITMENRAVTPLNATKNYVSKGNLNLNEMNSTVKSDEKITEAKGHRIDYKPTLGSRKREQIKTPVDNMEKLKFRGKALNENNLKNEVKHIENKIKTKDNEAEVNKTFGRSFRIAIESPGISNKNTFIKEYKIPKNYTNNGIINPDNPPKSQENVAKENKINKNIQKNQVRTPQNNPSSLKTTGNQILVNNMIHRVETLDNKIKNELCRTEEKLSLRRGWKNELKTNDISSKNMNMARTEISMNYTKNKIKTPENPPKRQENVTKENKINKTIQKNQARIPQNNPSSVKNTGNQISENNMTHRVKTPGNTIRNETGRTQTNKILLNDFKSVLKTPEQKSRIQGNSSRENGIFVATMKRGINFPEHSAHAKRNQLSEDEMKCDITSSQKVFQNESNRIEEKQTLKRALKSSVRTVENRIIFQNSKEKPILINNQGISGESYENTVKRQQNRANKLQALISAMKYKIKTPPKIAQNQENIFKNCRKNQTNVYDLESAISFTGNDIETQKAKGKCSIENICKSGDKIPSICRSLNHKKMSDGKMNPHSKSIIDKEEILPIQHSSLKNETSNNFSKSVRTVSTPISYKNKLSNTKAEFVNDLACDKKSLFKERKRFIPPPKFRPELTSLPFQPALNKLALKQAKSTINSSINFDGNIIIKRNFSSTFIHSSGDHNKEDLGIENFLMDECLKHFSWEVGCDINIKEMPFLSKDKIFSHSKDIRRKLSLMSGMAKKISNTTKTSTQVKSKFNSKMNKQYCGVDENKLRNPSLEHQKTNKIEFNYEKISTASIAQMEKCSQAVNNIFNEKCITNLKNQNKTSSSTVNNINDVIQSNANNNRQFKSIREGKEIDFKTTKEILEQRLENISRRIAQVSAQHKYLNDTGEYSNDQVSVEESEQKNANSEKYILFIKKACDSVSKDHNKLIKSYAVDSINVGNSTQQQDQTINAYMINEIIRNKNTSTQKKI